MKTILPMIMLIIGKLNVAKSESIAKSLSHNVGMFDKNLPSYTTDEVAKHCSKYVYLFKVKYMYTYTLCTLIIGRKESG